MRDRCIHVYTWLWVFFYELGGMNKCQHTVFRYCFWYIEKISIFKVLKYDTELKNVEACPMIFSNLIENLYATWSELANVWLRVAHPYYHYIAKAPWL